MQADSETVFRRLYPVEYFTRWLSEGIRPDGRTLGRSRATTIGLGALPSLHGSAMVRLGEGATAVLAGAKASVVQPAEEAPQQGILNVTVSMASFATPDYRAGRQADAVSVVTERLQGALSLLRLADQLCIREGKSVYKVDLDIYILSADGALVDAVLLAAVAALRDLTLPAVKPAKASSASKAGAPSEVEAAGGEAVVAHKLSIPCWPLSVTCCMHNQHLLVDPTAEEEAIATSTISVLTDAAGGLHGVFKSGGAATASPAILLQCIESAKLRCKEVLSLMQQAVDAADVAMQA
ncbi:hypothetical protein QJQ45_020046 [Haematococcus lacustris]|nr:hypothetical protein QJQ45_020046 [Haematococcus lacustris]